MRVLSIGGTGNISRAVTQLLAERGVDLTLLNRGRSDTPPDVRSIRADIRDRPAVVAALRNERFDVVIDWIAFTPEQVATDIELFAETVSQYVFISSATVYQQPSPFHPLLEAEPLGNPGWQYATDKIACEDLLRRETGFPSTIVRPAHTYGETRIPTAVDGEGYTIIDRMRRGKRVIVHDGGTSLWTLTHNTDFARALAGLLGNTDAVGECFHLTSDFALTWDQITETIAAAAGLEADIVHIPSERIADFDPGLGTELLCDKRHSLVFDNAKLKRFLPGFEATVSFANGIERSLAWFDADPARRTIDAERDALLDRIIATST
ncbi:MAG TPA: SDR family oxidoreductase [Gaiellaceae bacterium]